MEFHLLSNEKPIQMAAKELKNYLTRMGSEEILPKRQKSVTIQKEQVFGWCHKLQEG